MVKAPVGCNRTEKGSWNMDRLRFSPCFSALPAEEGFLHAILGIHYAPQHVIRKGKHKGLISVKNGFCLHVSPLERPAQNQMGRHVCAHQACIRKMVNRSYPIAGYIELVVERNGWSWSQRSALAPGLKQVGGDEDVWEKLPLHHCFSPARLQLIEPG